jgi:cytochrome c-type biogenesis protein CcmH/NrfF
MKWLSDYRNVSRGVVGASLVVGLLLSIATVSLSQDRPHGPEFRAAGNALMCQCGCGATIATCAMEHCHSAEPIREEIWDRLQSGDAVASIVETFKERYGLMILSAPPTTGFHLTAWVVPFLVLFIGAFVTRQVLRSWTRQTEAAGMQPATVNGISDAQRARIEKELRDLS